MMRVQMRIYLMATKVWAVSIKIDFLIIFYVFYEFGLWISRVVAADFTAIVVTATVVSTTLLQEPSLTLLLSLPLHNPA